MVSYPQIKQKYILKKDVLRRMGGGRNQMSNANMDPEASKAADESLEFRYL